MLACCWTCLVCYVIWNQLKLASSGLKHAGGGRCSDIFLAVISAYVLTFRAHRRHCAGESEAI